MDVEKGKRIITTIATPFTAVCYLLIGVFRILREMITEIYELTHCKLWGAKRR